MGETGPVGLHPAMEVVSEGFSEEVVPALRPGLISQLAWRRGFLFV